MLSKEIKSLLDKKSIEFHKEALKLAEENGISLVWAKYVLSDKYKC